MQETYQQIQVHCKPHMHLNQSTPGMRGSPTSGWSISQYVHYSLYNAESVSVDHLSNQLHVDGGKTRECKLSRLSFANNNLLKVINLGMSQSRAIVCLGYEYLWSFSFHILARVLCTCFFKYIPGLH